MPRARVTAEQLLQIVDPSEMPAYGIRDAARYLQMPPATLKSWVLGRDYPTKTGTQHFEPIITLPEPKLPLLSFYNLAEAHVLNAFRKDYRIELRKIRAAIDYVTEQFGWQHPLLQQRFETNGVDLFIDRLGRVEDASGRGQIVMDYVRAYFRRLERVDSIVVRLWPFTRTMIAESPKTVFIDPRVSFGRPSLVGCNVPTAIIAERYKAGESIESLAQDYGCDHLEIEEGLRCEIEVKIAA